MIRKRLIQKGMQPVLRRYFGGGDFHKPDYKKTIMTYPEDKSMASAFGVYHEITPEGLKDTKMFGIMDSEVEGVAEQEEVIKKQSYSEKTFPFNYSEKYIKYYLFTWNLMDLKSKYRHYDSGNIVNEKPHGYLFDTDVRLCRSDFL